MDGIDLVHVTNGITQNGMYGENNISLSEGTFVLAPGAERNGNNAAIELPTSSKTIHVDPNKVVMDYNTDFPKLPDAPPSNSHLNAKSAWGRQPSIQSTLVTEAYKLAAVERAARGLKKIGNTLEEQQKCNQIAQATGTKIELNEAKDQSLTILITGKHQNVEEARNRLVRDLQTQVAFLCFFQTLFFKASVEVEKEGSLEGSKLRSLEQEFFCRIYMPGREEKNAIIKIVGPNEHIIEAARRIKDISSEMAKQGNESINIPRAFYPWIRGAYNQNIENFARFGVRVNIPPMNGKNEIITITGEKEEVEKATEKIRSIYNEKKDFKTLSCTIPKAQHRFVIGQKRSGIDEILRETDVIVEVPQEDEESDTITLKGDQKKLGDALAAVYSKASSVITAEIKYDEWMRRYLIGSKGSKLQSLVPNDERLKIDFEDGGIIFFEGPPDSVKSAYDSLKNEIARLENEMSSQTIKVATNLHRHIIGRNGSLVNKIKDENDVQISIPDEKFNSDEIKIEGKKEGVENARKAILEIVTRLENEKSRDIVIPHRFHGQIIGKNGETVQKWRNEFPTVSISFPDATDKRDIVNLRGDKKEVDKLFVLMTKLSKDLELNNYEDTLPIFKDYYKHIIGKNGTHINKIREDTQTRIELPSGGDGRITIIGKQENVEKAIVFLNKKMSELANIVTNEINIPERMHARLLSGNRHLIRDIEDEFGGVHIIFPKDKGIHKVSIRGPKESVAKAEVALKQLVEHCEQTTEEVTVRTKPEYIKFLIGREGSKVKKLREKFPSMRIIFPSESDNDPQILLIGKKEDVDAVKKIYQKQITDLNETVEIQIKVDPKWHRHFIIRSAEVLKEIQSQNGNCMISFPRQDTGDNTVTLKGSKSCVESAKSRIEEIVIDLECQVTLNLCIPEEHHRSLMSHLNEIRNNYNVRIKIPDRGTTNDSGNYVDGIGPADLVQLFGRLEKCKEAEEALLQLIPVEKTIVIPLDYHSSFIGRQGESVRALMSTYAVRIRIPPAFEKNEEITIIGTPDNVESCLSEIRDKIAELDKQIEDRKLRSHVVTLDVPLKYHQRLIGPKGAHVNELKDRYDVQIKVPHSETKSENITVTGYEQNSNECADAIKKMIDEWESLISENISLDPRFHPRLIGQKGRNLRRIEEDFSVEIRMPNRNNPDPTIVVVSGKDRDQVEDCIDKLRAMEDDYISDLCDRGQYNNPRREEPKSEKKTTPQKVEITGAPWSLDSLEQFPVMGASQGGNANNMNGSAVWGSRR